MLNLIKLEYKKAKISVKSVAITNLILVTLLMSIVYISKGTDELSIYDYNTMFEFDGVMVRAVFLVFTAVIISRVMISEYTTKTINIMFMYPIKRMKIMVSKVFLILSFSFLSMFLSSIFVNICMYTINKFIYIFDERLTLEIISKGLIDNFIFSLIFSFISLIPMFVGMKKKSTVATIVTSVIVLSILGNGAQGSIIITTAMGVIGIIASYLSIRNVENADLLN
ncbi:ABC transporter permease [Clostridium intestinale]|uniref:ABC transporter permease n=1 Tax=Clostridium intestinale TaxID=36845 RepID=UPI0028E5315D|nr:ABC transporter permease [Clostridium intestinale]